jgi:SAM-dependent methyltransferase
MTSQSLCRVCGAVTEYFFSSFNTHGRNVVSDEERFSWYRCKACNSISLWGVTVDDDYFKKYYELGYYTMQGVKPGAFISKVLTWISRFTHKQRERWILRSLGFTPDRAKLLEIGFGSGAFLASLNPRFFSITGIEVNAEGVELARKRGLDVTRQDLRDLSLPAAAFDVVAAFHVLEHLERPEETLRSIRAGLRPGGILLIVVPCADALGLRVGREWWYHLSAPRHLFIPSQCGMRALLHRCGYEVLESHNEWYAYPQDLLWSLRKHPFRWLFILAYPWLKIFGHETVVLVCRAK